MDVLFLSRPLGQKFVYRALHSNEHNADPQRTLLLVVFSLQRVYCIVA
jgi:hypothetical protein